MNSGGASVLSMGGASAYDNAGGTVDRGEPEYHPTTDGNYMQENLYAVPSETQLTLLCLDYLRDLTRSMPASTLAKKEGLDADWLSVAVFALQNAFNDQTDLCHNTDAWKPHSQQFPSGDQRYSPDHLPPLSDIQNMILDPPVDAGVLSGTSGGSSASIAKSGCRGSTSKIAAANLLDTWYDSYEDSHPSNQHRMYSMNGLASRPLYLGELVSVACASGNIRSRGQAQSQMIQSPLFEQFLHAVESKGFFKNSGNNVHSQLYQERYQKVVAKFRTKLASKSANTTNANAGGGGGTGAAASVSPSVLLGEGGTVTAGGGGDGNPEIPLDKTQIIWERHQQRRLQTIIKSGRSNIGSGIGGVDDDAADPLTTSKTTPTINTSRNEDGIEPPPTSSQLPTSPLHNPEDLEKAENLKVHGNAAMQRKAYREASDAYTQALQLSPDGPNSHVYYSNRAAALLSQKEFQKAIWDSERALRLKPNYAKAHARLGLAHFLLGDYKQAMEAYTVALKYEPDNKSSKSYLEKAAKRLAQQQKDEHPNVVAKGTANGDNKGPTPSQSFSVVSEWEKNKASSSARNSNNNMSSSSPNNDIAMKDAEKYKVRGNQYMANRDYESALECYTSAIDTSPEGPQSHVYYSNRAAALCYLERYQDAARDSELSIQLQPTYGKAYARLGLSRFFLQDYEGAVQAYEQALQYDPDNAASKSYLAKAKLKVKSMKSSPVAATGQHASKPAHVVDQSKVDAEARRLMEDPNMQLMAKKALSGSTPRAAVRPQTPQHMMEDPEMQRIAKHAMNDPTMMGAVMAMSSGGGSVGGRSTSRTPSPSRGKY